MPPPPPPKRIKRPAKVLDEDDYTEALSQIIARDFFPGLAETQTQEEYLTALESKDKEWIESAGRRLTQVMTPGPGGRRARGRRGVSMMPVGGINVGDTPQGWGGDTPMSVVSDITTTSQGTKKEEVDTNLSLTAFQAKYTSEDNESFNELLDEQNIKRREKYAWMWSGNKILAPRQIAHREREQKLLTARTSSDTDAQTKMNDVYDNRPAAPDSWRSRPDNELMFTPSSFEDTNLESVQQAAERTSRATPKTVVYDNTRLPPPPSQEQPVPPSPSLSAIRDAIAGRPRPTASEAAYDGSETPRVNGYAFVDSEEPEPEPSYTPQITLSSGDSTPNPFKISENRKREDLHHRIVERTSKSKRIAKITSETKTPVPKFPNSPFVGRGRTSAGNVAPAPSSTPMLTPAAQRLLEKVGRTPVTRAGGKREESGLKDSWTPTPRPKRK